MMTPPPRPPSPPDGPPRGTNFSRRKAMQPLPPSPAFTRIRASSMNIHNQGTGNREQELQLPSHWRDQIRLAVLPVYRIWAEALRTDSAGEGGSKCHMCLRS